jgi:pimeloyl-ACP methyl ester carboxylesterase
MADLDYGPKGLGCEVRLRAGMLELVATRSGLGDPSPEVTGSVELAGNLALVARVAEYAANELAFRRLRSPEKRKCHKEAAARELKDAIAIAEMVLRTGSETISGWCSGCFDRTEHRQVRGHDRPRRKFLCQTCGTPTTQCAVPRCGHLAIVNPRALHTVRYCAAHRHEIPGFERLTDRLTTLADVQDWLRFESRNAARITKVTAGTIGMAVVVAPMAFFAAPAVGAALGSTAFGGSLTGAAATSHGLAMLGGGSIASGGLGMAGGTAVVTATGTALGGALGAGTAAAYAGADKSFRIEKVRSGGGTPVVFATGFLTEGLSGWDAWKPMLEATFPDSPVYQVHWGAKELKDLGALVAARGATSAIGKLVLSQAKKGNKAFGSVPGLGAALIARELATNPWTVAKTRAAMTGAVLADLIARTDEGPFVLMGHSLGARVMVSAAQALGTRSDRPRIESMHLLGAAVGKGGDWRTLSNAVSGTIWNYHSSNDRVLRWLFPAAEIGAKPVGLVGFKSKFPSISDRNVSKKVGDHFAYVNSVRLETE